MKFHQKEKHLGIMIAELQIRRSGEYLKYLNDFLWRPKTLCEDYHGLRWVQWDTGWKNSYMVGLHSKSDKHHARGKKHLKAFL